MGLVLKFSNYLLILANFNIIFCHFESVDRKDTTPQPSNSFVGNLHFSIGSDWLTETYNFLNLNGNSYSCLLLYFKGFITCERFGPIPERFNGLLSCSATADDNDDLLVLRVPPRHRLQPLRLRVGVMDLENIVMSLTVPRRV